MCICGPESAAELLQHHEQIRVATKYPRIAKDYFYNKKHQTVEIIKLNGSIELAPIVGLAEVIVDIVETGSTLRENGLEVLEEICPLSARVVVNQVSMKMEHERITKMINDLREVLNNIIYQENEELNIIASNTIENNEKLNKVASKPIENNEKLNIVETQTYIN